MTSGDRQAAAAAPRTVRWYVLLAALVGGFAWLYLAPPTTPATWRGETMGTTYTVKLAVPLDDDDHAAVGERIRAELDAVVAAMSTYEPDSEVSRFARAPSGVPFELSPHTMNVLRVAAEVGVASGGAFDVTVRPLVEAWGFGASGRHEGAPSEAELERLGRTVGWAHLELDPARSTVTKTDAAVQIDLSGVAKGYAVDRVAAALDARGLTDYLVEVGGETRARGQSDRGRPWRVAVQRPGTTALAVELDGHGVATSGNDKNFWERDGQRYGHTLDPRTRSPVRHRLAGASVIHTSTAHADAWATALMVLGDVEGARVAERERLAAALFIADGDGLRTETTRAYEGFLARREGADREGDER